MKRESLTCTVRILGVFGLALLISGPPALADAFTFTAAPNTKRFNFEGGESQSAVIAPGKKGQCPNGRIFTSDEQKDPPLASISSLSKTTNVVHWRNLPGPKKLTPGEGVSVFFPSGIGGPSAQTGIMIGKAPSKTGLFSFLNKPVAVNGVSWGWEQQDPDSFPWQIPLKTDLRKHVSAIIAGNTVLARVPGKNEILLLAFPTMVEKIEGQPKTKTQGFRVYYYHAKNVDPQNNQFLETDPIIPTGPAEKSMIMHLTAIDPGDGGPILLYWYDLNGEDKTARIRGRFIYTENEENLGESKDFDVALTNGESTEFSLEPGGPYWYGDYKTAGGFISPKVEGSPPFTVLTYRYFPMWIQPDRTVNYTEVTVTRTIVKPLFKEKLSKDPFRKMFTECCDFISVIEKAKAQKGNVSPEKLAGEATALASRLVTADPNLKDPKLWIGRKQIVKLQPRRTTFTTLEQSPIMRNIFKDHQEKSRRHIKQK